MRIKCNKCGQGPIEASKRGAYLVRTSPLGQAFIGECAPSCDGKHGDQDDALIAAVMGKEAK